MNAGPPPVQNRMEAPDRAQANLTVIEETFRADKGAGIRAMFGGDADLMRRFLAVAFSAIAKDNDLLRNADPMSVVQAIKDAAAMGLEPTGLNGEGFINVYAGKAAFQPMYRGYLKRIRNSGQVTDLDCQLVYKNDEFELLLGTDPVIKHRPVLEGERDGYRGAYAWAAMPSGLRLIEWMDETEINYVRDHFSPSVKKGRASPWDTSWGEMARKTVIRRLAKRLPGSAVNVLLAADAAADNAAAEARVLVTKTNESIAAIQRLALAATTPEHETGSVQSDADSTATGRDADGLPGHFRNSDVVNPEVQSQAVAVPSENGNRDATSGIPPAPGETVDPNVAAAMELAREQERLARFRGRS